MLLQAVFFGTAKHRELVAWLLEHAGALLGVPAGDTAARERVRCRLLAACNVRGYTATAMAELWHNAPLHALLASVDRTGPAERDAYRAELLASIAVPVPADAAQRDAQRRTDALVAAITAGFATLAAAARDPAGDVPAAGTALLAAVRDALAAPGLDLDRRGGPLAQTPLIAALTGVDPAPRGSAVRLAVTRELLCHGADPDLPELHPMGVDAVIRAAVLHHVGCLHEIARWMGPLAFAAAINERPAVNGQTALDDIVHRALTAPAQTLASHLDLIRWVTARGGRVDIPDLTGVSVARRAELALADPAQRDNAVAVLAALGLAAPQPAG